MPIFKDTLLTERGLEMAVKAVNGQGSFKITKAVGSSKSYNDKTDTELRQLSSLDNEVPGRINEQENTTSKVTAIKTSYTNELIPGGYMVNTTGFYAKDNDTGEEFLYSVTPSSVGQLIPEQSDNNFDGFNLTIYVVVGNVEKMTVELTPGGDASVEYVKGVVSKAKDDIMAEFSKLSDSVKNDLQPALDKKENANDHKTDIDNLKLTLPASIKFSLKNGDNLDTITTNGTYPINNINLGSLSANLGLPNVNIYGALVVTAQQNQTYQLIRDNLGNMYERNVGRKWTILKTADADNASLGDLDRMYQNAVNTAKAYTDSNTPYTMTASETEALKQANNSVKPGLFLYPTDADKSSISIAKHVLGIYSFGVGNLPTITIDLTNLNSSKFTFNNAYATYDPNVKRVYLHGSISAKNVSGNTNVFSFNIKQFSMNDIDSSWLNFQTFSIDTDTYRQQIIATTSSNSTLNLEGCTINLKYDGSLKDKYVPPVTTPAKYYASEPSSNFSVYWENGVIKFIGSARSLYIDSEGKINMQKLKFNSNGKAVGILSTNGNDILVNTNNTNLQTDFTGCSITGY